MDIRPQNNRRDFLSGKAAVDAVADLAQRGLGASDSGEAPDSSGALPTTGPSPYVVHVGRRAMACQFEVVLNAGQYPHGTEAAIEALELVDALEAQMTVYRDDSEISLINQRAAEQGVRVEPNLFALLEQSVGFYHDTDHAFDIASGPLSKVWGFFRRSAKVPAEADLIEALEKVGSRYLELDPEAKTIRFSRPGVELNLGSIGKGYALDRAADVLVRAGVQDFLLHGGQSSVLARGSQGDGEGWIVGLRHPLRADRRLAEIRLRDQALGTSGSGTQFFRQGGKRYGHILDPRTGRPAEGVLSSTVIAPTGAQADALATAFYVMGTETAVEYGQAYREIGAALISSRAGGSLHVTSFGISDESFRMLEGVA